MGMYDTIKCSFPLPHPPNSGELTTFNFCDLQYQTKDLDNVLDYYEIRADGTIWHEIYDIEDKHDPDAKGINSLIGMHTKTNIRWEQLMHTGVIKFCDYHQDDFLQNDYWIEFCATFYLGKMTALSIAKFEITPSADRKAREAQWQKESECVKILWNRWYMKYGYRYYDMLVRQLFILWNRVKNEIPESHQVERWLRPL